ncbi:hypothetical protein ACWKWP_09540 [Agromyces soli]
MKAGRTPLTLGAHGKITTDRLDIGRFRASARIRTWDDEVHRVTATGDSAADAQAVLQERLAERLRVSELSVWRSLTSADPFHELVICWLDDIRSFSDASRATCAMCERVVRTQLMPAFGHLTIGEITRKPIEDHLGILRARSEDAAGRSQEVLELLLDFGIGEGAIDSNPMDAVSPGHRAHGCLGNLDDHRNVVRGRIELRREERRHQARVDD